MVGIQRLVIISLVTASAGIRSALISGSMTFYTLSRGMGPGERIDLAVVESLLFAIGMTSKTRRTVPGISGNPLVLLIHIALIVFMTIDTCELGIVGWIGMTIATRIPLSLVAS